jgi:PAS domain S-box-containing protein
VELPLIPAAIGSLIFIALLVFFFWPHPKQEELQRVRKVITPEAPRAILNQLRELFDDSPVAYCEVDLNGIIRRANRVYSEIRALPYTEVVGRHCAEFVPEHERERYRHEVHLKLIGEKVLRPYQRKFARPDGSLLTLEVHESLITDEGNNVTGLRIGLLDISEHSRKEEEAWQVTSELRAIFQALPDVFLRLDSKRVILDRRAPSETNIFPAECVNRNLQEVLPRQAFQLVNEAISRMEKTGVLTTVEYAAMIGGDPRFFEARLIPFGWHETLMIVRDITERKTAVRRTEQYAEEVERKNEALQEALSAAREATELKNRFLANMSHEIRTPMNGVLGMLEFLLNTELTGEQREYADSAKQSGGALLAIINDILDISKIEAGKLSLESVPFELAQMLRDVTAHFALRARAKGLEFRAELPGGPLAVKGDPGRLRQVLTNLLGNAIKFTERGKIGIRAEVVSRKVDTVTCRFYVYDTGIGISEQQKARLFQSFVQVDGSSTRKYGGTGLGLVISKELVQMLGGEISVESQHGQGSVFTFTAVFALNAAAALETRKSLAGMRVLAAVEGLAQHPWMEALRAAGCELQQVSAAARLVPALKLAAQGSAAFRAVVVDIDLPNLNPTVVARDIRRDGQLGQVALVALTSAPEQLALLQESGYAAGLSKPVLSPQLEKILADLTTPVPAMPPRPAEMKPPPMAVQAPAPAPVAAPKPAAVAAAPRRGRALLAEDNAVNQKIASKLLAKAGFVADVVDNGAAAVDAVQKVAYDLVLMDCQMPEMDGFEATAVIRQLEGDKRHTRIIALTANAMAGDREKCLAAGMDDYLSKPVSLQALVEAIDRSAGVATAKVG